MGWNRLERFTNVDDNRHWLGCLKPSVEERDRRELDECLKALRRAFAKNRLLASALRKAVRLIRQQGRVEGLRQGLELYEHGRRILENENKALFSIVKYIHSNPKASSADICAHLDREVRRVKDTQKTAETVIDPPEKWKCETWDDAFEAKRNDVDVLFNKARSLAKTKELDALIMWAKWGEPKKRAQRKKRRGAPKGGDSQLRFTIPDEQ